MAKHPGSAVLDPRQAVLVQDDCLNVLRKMLSGSVHMTMTSPPYDDLRTYNGYTFDFESIAQELFRVTKEGGIVVWVVGDATVNGSETGTSFKQALYFMQCGFKLHDTMIWNKGGFSAVGALRTRYAPVFEYMFVFVKGKIGVFNPLKDRKNKKQGKKSGTIRQRDGSTKAVTSIGKECNEYGQRFNVWEMSAEMARNIQHPAPFPLSIPLDHILSWTNPGDLVLDPFMGSGTTGIACKITRRKFIGIEISEEYLNYARERIESANIEAETGKIPPKDEACP